MASKALTLRVKTKQGQHVSKALTLESTVTDLKANLAQLTNIPPHALKVLQGFPPKPVDLTNNGLDLGSLNFRSGDTLIVEENPAATQEAENARNDALLQAYESQTQSEGFLTRQVVPANNSCLFTSVDFVMEERTELDLSSAEPMRQLIASVVLSDPDTYSEGFLGKTNPEYCQWIMDDQSWGGGIEVAILSAYYKVEIAVVDTQTVRIDRFGEDKNYKQRVLLIYDGIHYDPLVLEPVDPSQSKRTKFPATDEAILTQALELAAEAKSSRQFTDVAKFTLRCLICQKCLTGQTEAQLHAKETGHINFGEV